MTDYLAHLRTDVDVILQVLDRGPLDAPVTACLGWSVRELAEHLGAVHRWATEIVQTGAPQAEKQYAGDDLPSWFAVGADQLLAAPADPMTRGPGTTQDPGPSRGSGYHPLAERQAGHIPTLDAAARNLGRGPSVLVGVRSLRVLAVAAVALAAGCSSSGSSTPAPSITPVPTPVLSSASPSSSPSPTPIATPKTLGLRPTDVTFVSALHGWVVDRGRLETSIDAGETWTALPAAPAPVTQLRFATDLIGYAWASQGPLWVTRDGGQTWQDGHLAMVEQVEAAAGSVWALAGPAPYPGVWRAAVGTERFVTLGMTPDRSGTLDVHGATAYVVGNQGAGPIQGSLDVLQGAAKRNAPLPCRGPDSNVPFAPLGVGTDGRVLLVCDPAPGSALVRAYLSSDQARTWTSIPPPPEDPTDVTATRSRLFAWGRDLHVQDAGHWSIALAGPTNGDGFVLVGFQDDTHGVALARDGVLHLTSDGGHTWTRAQV